MNERDLIHFEIGFLPLYQQYCVFAFGIVRDKEVARDIVSGAVLKLLGSEGEFPNLLAIRKFMKTCIRNDCLNHLYREKMHQRHQLSVARHYYSGAADKLIPELLCDRETIIAIQAAIERLPGQARRIIKLTTLGIPTQEIANLMGLSAQTVRNTKCRGIEILRRELVSKIPA